jgi:hypothetical protein
MGGDRRCRPLGDNRLTHRRVRADAGSQAILLRVLQEREFERVGGTQAIKIEIYASLPQPIVISVVRLMKGDFAVTCMIVCADILSGRRTALAIVDDIGAVLVIALFYTAELSWTSLALGAVFLLAMFAANLAGVRHPIVYLMLGRGVAGVPQIGRSRDGGRRAFGDDDSSARAY